jgi:hypothetical protein
MSHIKTKRVLWTIAVLLALMFVAALLWHKHDEPKIIGKLSLKDVSEISKAVSGLERLDVEFYLEHGDIRELIHSADNYVRNKIISIEVLTNGQVLITIGTGTNKNSDEWYLVKEEDRWVLAPPARLQIVPIKFNLATNAPVSQSDVGR